MELGKMIEDAASYAKEAVWGKWLRWILLIICMIIFPLIYGYIMEIYRGKKPAPELEHWGRLFIDGLKLLVAGLVYAIPVILVVLLFIGIAFMAFTGSPDTIFAAIAGFAIVLIVVVILAIIISLIAVIGMVRLARTGRFGEAFNISAILTTIRNIGWGNYIAALIVLWLIGFVYSIVISVLIAIPLIGWIIWLFLLPPFIIFEARFITLIYESGELPEAVEGLPVE